MSSISSDQLRARLVGWVVRRTGLPSGASSAGRLTATSSIVDNLELLDTKIRAAVDRYSVWLHSVIGGCEDTMLRREFLAERRATFRGRRPSEVASWTSDPDRARGSLIRTQLVRLHDDRDRAIRTLKQMFESESAIASARLAAWVRTPHFLDALALGSHELALAATRWLDGSETSSKHEQTRESLMRYLARAALKPSPFSWFASAGLASDAGQVAASDGAPELENHVELNAQLEWALAVGLLGDELRFRRNVTAEVDGDCVVIFNRAGNVVRLQYPGLAAVLAVVDEPITKRTAVNRLTQRFDLSGEYADKLIRELVRVDAIVPELPQPTGKHPTRIPRSERSNGLVGALRRLSASRGPGQRLAAVATLRREVKGLTDSLGIDPAVIPRKNLCYESVVSRRGSASDVASRPSDAELLCFDALNRACAPYDLWLPTRLAIAELFRVNGVGDDGLSPIGLSQVWNASASTELGMEARALWANPFLLPPTAIPRVVELQHAREVLEQAVFRARTSSHWVVPLGDVDAALEHVPSWVPARPATSIAFQRLRDRTIVVNGIGPGDGVTEARLRWLQGAPARRLPPREDQIEIGGLHGSTLNRRAPVARYELEWPGETSGRPEAERIQSHELRLRLGEDGLPHWVWRGRPVSLILPSAIAHGWLPAGIQLLLRAGGSFPMSPRFGARAGILNRTLPALRFEDMVVERRGAIVTAERGPARVRNDPLEALRDARRLRSALDLADEVFARAVPLAGAEESASARSWASEMAAKARKPIPIDLRSSWGAKTLQALRLESAAVLLQDRDEALDADRPIIEEIVEFSEGMS